MKYNPTVARPVVDLMDYVKRVASMPTSTGPFLSPLFYPDGDAPPGCLEAWSEVHPYPGRARAVRRIVDVLNSENELLHSLPWKEAE